MYDAKQHCWRGWWMADAKDKVALLLLLLIMMITWKDFGLQQTAEAEQIHFPGCLSLVTQPRPNPVQCVACLCTCIYLRSCTSLCTWSNLCTCFCPCLCTCTCVHTWFWVAHSQGVFPLSHAVPASRVQCVTRPTPHHTPCDTAMHKTMQCEKPNCTGSCATLYAPLTLPLHV